MFFVAVLFEGINNLITKFKIPEPTA